MELPLGWFTDLAVHRLHRAEITERADHLVVRSPENPTYYWGNVVIVTDPGAVDDAARWLEVFEREHPTAAHRSFGLPVAPSDPAAWTAVGVPLVDDPVMVLDGPVQDRPLPDGYRTRPLTTDDDWAQSTALREAAFGSSEFERRTTEAMAAMSRRGEITWFGAFRGEELVSELGITDCGSGTWRYQSVVTHPDHRRRGLTGHLLGVAEGHARQHGASRCVIIAEEGDASRLYAAVGFVEHSRHQGAFRGPVDG